MERTQPRTCRPKGKDVITDTWTHGSSKTAVGPVRGRFSLAPASHDGGDGWNLWLFVDAGQLPCAETRTSRRKPGCGEKDQVNDEPTKESSCQGTGQDLNTTIFLPAAPEAKEIKETVFLELLVQDQPENGMD